jgi:hypothetical protein
MRHKRGLKQQHAGSTHSPKLYPNSIKSGEPLTRLFGLSNWTKAG